MNLAIARAPGPERSPLPLSAGWIADRCGGRLLRGSPLERSMGVSSDTRGLRPGQLFIALRGPRFDAHAFAGSAVEAGAAGLLVDEQGLAAFGPPPGTAFVVVVPDTSRALLDLARAYLDLLGARVLAITGSYGKTTTKDLCAALLRGNAVAATLGNFNNRIGLPLSVLAAPAGTRFFVAELGISLPGEMDELAAVVRPSVAVLTGVAEAHLEGLGDRAGVLREKARLFEHFAGVGADAGIAVLPADLLAEGVPSLDRAASARTFSADPSLPADAALLDSRWMGGAQRLRIDLGGESLEASLRLPGRHNAANLLAALLAVEALGVEPDLEAAAEVRPAAHRSALLEIGPYRVLDDAYNANPASMDAALVTASEIALPGRMHAVLGEMLELGARSPGMHRDLGRRAAEIGAASIVAWGGKSGELAAGVSETSPSLPVQITSDPDEAAEFFLAEALPGDLLLVKGSRASRTERVIERLAERLAERLSPPGGEG